MRHYFKAAQILTELKKSFTNHAHFTALLTCKLTLCQEFLCCPIEYKNPEGIFLTGVQACHCGTASCRGQHQFWLWNRWRR